jgi:hypothetical protein
MSERTLLSQLVLGPRNQLGLRHSCSRCRALMRLVGIEPPLKSDDLSDIHTFECVVCGYVAVESVPQIRLM